MLGIESLTGGLPLAVYKFLDRWLYVGQCLRDQLFFRTASPMSLTMNPDTRLKTQTPLPDEEQATKKIVNTSERKATRPYCTWPLSFL